MVFWSQLILAARRDNSGDKGWVQLLVFVVMAIFWAIGGIAKARANKASSMDKEKGASQTPESLRRRKEIQLQQLMGRNAFEQQRLSSASAVKKRVKPVNKPMAEVKTRVLPRQDEGEIGVAEGEISVESLVGFEGPDELKRAILHYEILGKPLSLRQS